MKGLLTGIVVITLLSSCGGSGNKEKSAGSSSAVDISKDPDYRKGLDLIAKSDCLTCHKVDEKVTGPSYREVAKKYADRPDAVSYLAGKIISGGNGVWGEVFMTPHANLSKDDAEAMVKYIMLLKQ